MGTTDLTGVYTHVKEERRTIMLHPRSGLSRKWKLVPGSVSWYTVR